MITVMLTTVDHCYVAYVFLCLQVRVLYTAPTLIRSLMQHGDHFVTQHDRSSLRILGTVGEPINPHAWDWYHQVRLTGGGV
jgi:acetyl-CoA synthetase